MQFIIEGLRKVVVLVLLMELVLQLQSGKQYEQYIRMLVGIMVVYSLISGILGVFTGVEDRLLAPMEEFQWAGDWYFSFEEEAWSEIAQAGEEISEASDSTQNVGAVSEGVGNLEVQVNIAPISQINIGEIKIQEISRTGGLP